MAIYNPYLNKGQELEQMNNIADNTLREFSKSVDCGAGHYFCW